MKSLVLSIPPVLPGATENYLIEQYPYFMLYTKQQKILPTAAYFHNAPHNEFVKPKISQ